MTIGKELIKDSKRNLFDCRSNYKYIGFFKEVKYFLNLGFWKKLSKLKKVHLGEIV